MNPHERHLTAYVIYASLAQSVERETLNLKVAGSTPAWGFVVFLWPAGG
jgi:hypothetical protein